MVDLSSNQTHNPSPVPNSPSLSHEEHYGDVFGPLRPSTTLSLPEIESSSEVEEPETGGPYPTRRLPNLNFTPTHEGSLLGSIHTRIAALRSTTADAQTRYSQAVNSSIPQDPVINRNLRMTIANALWNSTAFFEEEEAAAQLLRYREMFVYLSQRHAESLASSSLCQAQRLVRRGQISVAAIRLTSGQCQSNANHSVAQGHHARHPSEVSVWDWRPWREITLAEKISERRRKRAEKERERRRARFLREEIIDPLSDNEGEMNEALDEGRGEDITPESFSMEFQTRWRRTPRKKSTDQMRPIGNKVHFPDGESTDTGNSPNEDYIDLSSSNLNGASLKGLGSSTDGATSQERLMPASNIPLLDSQRLPAQCRPTKLKHEISWRIPVYRSVSSPVPLPERNTRLVSPTIMTVTNAKDMFQRSHTINEPSGMGYVSSSPSGLGPGISPQISPKSQASPNVSTGNCTSTTSTGEISSILPPETATTSLSQLSSDSFREASFEYYQNESVAGSDSSDSGSTVGASRSKISLGKIKTVFKTFPLKIVNFPWSSSSEEEKQISIDSSPIPSSSEQSWPLNDSIPQNYGLVPHPIRQKYHPHTGYFDDLAPQTRIHSPQPKTIGKNITIIKSRTPPHPGTKLASNIVSLRNSTIALEQAPSMRHRESDPLTRTEKEYQEILSTLNELKRDRRAWRRKRSSIKGKVQGRIVEGAREHW